MGSSSFASMPINTQCIELGPCLHIEMQLSFIRYFYKTDVKKALFSIVSSKSPGPNGYGSEFYREMWHDLGDEISKAILDFFHSGRIPKELNETVLALVPKVEFPNKVVDYRPNSYCNTLYKCISKVNSSRLVELLLFLVGQNQGAFVKGRSLAHNILIFQDLINNRKNTSLRCALKIDLGKAYDTVDWDFLENFLTSLRFPTKFIQ
uniref:Reverse transcriptase domain-containing protein n=1 Tax=Cannabis sativa TaxID=3483 RepID=A0A803Q8S2_CANSA